MRRMILSLVILAQLATSPACVPQPEEVKKEPPSGQKPPAEQVIASQKPEAIRKAEAKGPAVDPKEAQQVAAVVPEEKARPEATKSPTAIAPTASKPEEVMETGRERVSPLPSANESKGHGLEPVGSPESTPAESTETKTLAIIHTGNVAGELEPCG